jgi:regulator of protease activity HflC (stomatin/prohibitin superfamily)
MNQNKFVLPLVGVLSVLVLFFFGMPFQIVGTGYAGVVTRLGKTTGRVVQPGFSWKAPFIDNVILFNLRTVKSEVEAIAATKDLQDVTANVAIVYRLEPATLEDLYTEIGSGENVSTVIILPIVQESIKQTTARFTAEELITRREEVKTQIDKSLNTKLATYNVVVQEVAITNFEFSRQFSNAVEAKQVAEQKAKQAAYELEQAKKEVETFKLQALALNEFTLRKMFIEKWDGHLPTTVSDAYLLKTLPESTK